MDNLKAPGKHSKRTQGYPLRDPADIEREAGREDDRRREQRELYEEAETELEKRERQAGQEP